MRVMVAALMTLTLSGIVLAQERTVDPDQSMEIKTPITLQQILELPRRDKGPEITLEEALKIAKSFIYQQKIDISSSYLFEAKWVSENPGEERWHFWWVGLAGAKDVEIAVSEQGKPKLKR